MSRRRRRCEEGSALILALVFLSLFGLWVGAQLFFVDSSLLVSQKNRELGYVVYDADAGIEGAVNFLRDNQQDGVEGQPCRPFQLKLGPPRDPDRPVAVQCEAQQGAGSGAQGWDNPGNTPSRAILALGSVPGEGIVQTGTKDLSIGGSIVSNSKISVGFGQKMHVGGDAGAVAGCGDDPARIVIEPPGTTRNCALPGPEADPAYPTLLDPAPAPDTAGPYPAGMPYQDLAAQTAACTAGSRVVRFNPGYYDDAVKLSGLTSATSACAGSIFWFKPGMYYFDFNFRKLDTSECISASDPDCLWRIALPTAAGATGSIVGGTPKGWDPDDPPAGLLGAQSCQTDGGTAGTGAPGVQFVFGGKSHVEINDGAVELCAQGSPTAQQIVVYGVSGAAAAPADLPAATLASADNDPAATAGFVPAENATGPLDDVTADAVAAATATQATLRTAFAPPSPPIPEHARIDSAELRIRHGAGAGSDVGSLGLSATVLGLPNPVTGSHDAPCPASGLCVAEGLRTDTIDLRSLGLKTAAAFNSGLGVDYGASLPGEATPVTREMLDGMTLAIRYTVPAYEGPQDCLAVAPYQRDDPLSCALVKIDPNVPGSSPRLAFRGTIYAAAAAVDARLPADAAAFERGVVARSVALDIPDWPTTAGALVSVPSTARTPRVVELTARVWDPDKDPPAYTDRVRAVVRFVDPGPDRAAEPPEVTSWKVLRGGG